MPTKLGQNFLKNREIVKKIIQSADLKPDDLVLEIGPGKGIMTEELAKHAGKVISVEIDKDLVKKLDSRFHGNEKIKIINADILKLNTKNIFCHSEREAKVIEQRSEAREGREAKSGDLDKQDSSTSLGMTTCEYKLIANLPYYITSPIIRLFLETENPPKEMILMVQKEVAERIVAKPGKMSILAVSVQYYADPEIIFYVGKENFDPVPEVDSAVIRVTRNPVKSLRSHGASTKYVTKEERTTFFRIVRAGFSAKRKTLVNNLVNSLHLDKKEVENKLKALGILPNARAQELSIDDWKRLADMLE